MLAFLCPLTVYGQGIHLHAVRIPNRIGYWAQHGFVDMVPPVRLPTDKTTNEKIMVWLRIPAGKKITVQWLADQKRYTLKFPPGTVTDRIDSGENQKQAMFVVNGIADVRGARIDADGRTWWHVYEPVPGESSKWLRGYAWLRIGPKGDNRAADSLIKLYYPGAPAKAKQEMAVFRRLNQCSACHRINRPVPTKTLPLKFLGHVIFVATPETDGDGFFQPITVLTDTMTLVNSRAWDLNAGDPYIMVWCGKDKAKLTTRGDSWRRYLCPDRGVPVGKLDMAAALKHKDPHALKVCVARKYLYQHMNEKGRKDFARFFAECSIH
ncbi:MAG: hypothetical protein ACRES9_04140 [Gammaproteobacteria bacterium]